MHANPEPSDTETIAEGSTTNLKTRAMREARRFAVMFLYLWAILGVYVLDERVILAQRGTVMTAQGFAFINALILAKVMLVVEDLNLLRWLGPRPLIYPILCDSLLLSILFICFHVIEKLIAAVLAGKSFAESVPAIGGGGFVGLACVAVILFVMLIPFFAFKHVARKLGPGRLNAMLFGTPMRGADR